LINLYILKKRLTMATRSAQINTQAASKMFAHLIKH
jgi:hypothetical protein